MAPSGVAVVLYPAPPTALPATALTVVYVAGNTGPSTWPLLNYDPVTKLFSEASPGVLARSGVTLTQGASFALAVGGVPALAVSAGVVTAPDFNLVDGWSGIFPRIEFQIGGRTVAVVAPCALYVNDLSEGFPVMLGADEFDFYSSSGLTAVLNVFGLRALAIAEGGV